MRDIWEYNKKEIIIGLILTIIIVIVGISIFNKKEEKVTLNDDEEKIETIVLFGSKEITLEEGEKYIEPGYYAITNKKEIKKDEIEVTPKEINTEKAGIYTISYTIKDKIEKRNIIVVKKETKEESKKEETPSEQKEEEKKTVERKINLTLKGESTIVLDLGDTYVEPGYTATDNIDGNITNKVKVNGNVNTNEAGTYKRTYEVENGTIKESKTRTIIVKTNIIDAKISGNPTSKTDKNVILKIEVTGNNFYYLKYPDGTISKDKVSTYEIEKNGTYKFLIYDTNNNYITKKVVVDKINKEKPINGSCTATLKDGKTTFKVNITSGDIKSYNYNSTYSSNSAVYTVNKFIRKNNYVIATSKSNKQKKINCSTKLEALPPIIPSSTKKYQANTDTLKINVIKDGGMYLSYVWVKDPVNQLKKSYTSGSSKLTEYILEDTVKKDNLKNKYIIGFNASPPCNDKYYGWPGIYNLKEPSPLMIQNGKVLINDPNKNSTLYIYYLDDSNQLKYTNKVNYMTVEERKKVYNEIIKSGAQNTMTWRPILVDNYKVVKLEDDYAKLQATRKNGICQLNTNNFIIITSENSNAGVINFPKLAEYGQKLGCRVFLQFDAGGSTSLLWKNKGSNDVSRITGGGRELTSVMYFTELN